MVILAALLRLFFGEGPFSCWRSLGQVSFMMIAVLVLIACIHKVVKIFTFSSDHFMAIGRVP